MSQQRKGGLGKGLAALIPTAPEQGPRLGESAADVILGPRSGSTASVSAHPAGPPRPKRTVSRETPGGARQDADTRKGAESQDGAHAQEGAATELVDAGAVYRELAPGSIEPNPRQPRSVFDDEALAELTHSVKEFGLLQPIVVRELGGGRYQLIMGERRWRASQAAGLEAIPAIVRQTEDDDLLRDALLENIHRVQLNPLEEAAAYQQLLEEFDVTQTQLAERLGRSRPAITNAIRLLQLPTAVQRRVAAGVLTAGHARALLSLESGTAAQDALAARIVAEGLSVRATEEIVTLANREGPAPETSRVARGQAAEPDPALAEIAARLSDRFDTRVSVTMGRRKGRVTIDVGSSDDLHRVVALLERREEPEDRGR